jgi:hypothetical protein
MTKELITLYKELLFNVPQTTPSLKTYAIGDSIRDEKVKEKILFSNLNHTDLWHEELFENEQEVPLYLVELEKENELLDYLLNHHQKSIATYFISPYSLETLQTYYSMFTHVNIEVEENNANKGIFGFYDPNILANYIQTLYTQEKVDEFFAGAAMWLSPSVEIETELYIAFRDKEGEVDDVSIELTSLLEEENPSFNFDNASLPTLPNLEAYAHEVNIDHTQVKMFDDVEKVKFIDDIFREYKAEGHTFYYPEEFNKELAFNLFDEAKNINILSEAGVYRYILLGLTVSRPMNELKFYGDIVNAPDEDAKIKIMDEMMNKIIEQRRRDNGI